MHRAVAPVDTGWQGVYVQGGDEVLDVVGLRAVQDARETAHGTGWVSSLDLEVCVVCHLHAVGVVCRGCCMQRVLYAEGAVCRLRAVQDAGEAAHGTVWVGSLDCQVCVVRHLHVEGVSSGHRGRSLQ